MVSLVSTALLVKEATNMSHGINSYGFADGNGDSITRGLQLTEEQAYGYAQEQADARGMTVEFWVEGDPSVDDEPCESLASVEPTQPATIESLGNGLCDVGEYVSCDGELYQVVSFVGPIQAGRNGGGDWIRARVVLADWSDVDDDTEPRCIAIVGDDGDDS